MTVLAGHLSQHLEARLAPQCAQCLAPVHTVTTNKGFQKKTPKEAESCKFKEEKTKVSSQKDRTERMLNLKVPTLQARKTPRLGVLLRQETISTDGSTLTTAL